MRGRRVAEDGDKAAALVGERAAALVGERAAAFWRGPVAHDIDLFRACRGLV